MNIDKKAKELHAIQLFIKNNKEKYFLFLIANT